MRRLKGTMDLGLVLKPDTSCPLDCFVDADFVGLYGYEQPYDPSSVKCQSGFVLCDSNCPILSSKLQHLIATSTTEMEYNALGHNVQGDSLADIA
jgi:hypothetical protein